VARKTIVVIGGGLAGATAAARAREIDDEARILLVERSSHVGYATSGPAYWLSGEAVNQQALDRRDASFFWDFYRIEVKTGVSADRLDAASRRVVLSDGPIDFTALIYAAGATSLLPEVPGLAGATNLFEFRTPADLEEIRHALGEGSRRVVVLGGSAVGIEAADAFLRGAHTVALVESSARLLPEFSDAAAQRARRALEDVGVTVSVGDEVAQVRVHEGRIAAVVLRSGREVEADLVVAAGAIRARTDLLRDAGAELHEDGSVSVDESCATSLANVYACGLCVALPHAITGWPVWLPQAALADKTAQVAGTAAAGGRACMSPILGTVIVRAGDITLARTGLDEAEAVDFAGKGEVSRVSVHGSSCDRFLSAASPLSVDLLFHQGNGRILGAEVRGREGVDKRIDVLAVAIQGNLTVEQLSLLDLAYAPPFSTARDVVNVAGATASAAREGLARAYSASELDALRGRVTVVDVEPERSEGAVKDALVIPLRELRDRLPSLPKGKPLVFLSHTGAVGYLAARMARQRGFKDAGYLSGGMLSYRAGSR
jgi:NADPH-dependent 2,4-dienoyl-CoA reductase/sulfur reductase-like enzyme/rhodanese-related sulfurtransferase